MRWFSIVALCGCSASAGLSTGAPTSTTSIPTDVAFTSVPTSTSSNLTEVTCAPNGDVTARDAAGNAYAVHGAASAQAQPFASAGDELFRVSGWNFERSQDRGATWVATALPGAGDRYTSYRRVVPLPGGKTVFVLGLYMRVVDSLEDAYAFLLRSDDGGVSWPEVWRGPDTGPGGYHQKDRDRPSIAALAANTHGVLIATADRPGMLLVSVNGGRSFDAVPAATHEQLFDVAADADRVYVVGDRGTILESSDGGQTYAPQASGVSIALRAVTTCRDGSVWVVGDHGTVLRRAH